MAWTDESVTILQTMWEAGDYASTIARELGFSRNAVIGKANRLKLVRRKGTPRGRTPSNRPISPALQNKAQRPTRLPRKPHTPTEPQAEVIHLNDNTIPLAQRRSIATIKDGECHFPVGDPASPEFFYCGAPIHGERPYCLGHQQRMFTPPRPRAVRATRYIKCPAFRASQG